MQLQTLVKEHFVGYATSVAIMTGGMCVIAPIPGQELIVPTVYTVRL